MFNSLSIESVDEKALHDLIGSLEEKQTEFKEVLPSQNPNDIVEKLLKPVSAMANTLGGDIIYGIREGKDTDGRTVAQALVGISRQDPDDVKQRLESLIRGGISPRIIGHSVHPVQLASGGYAFIVRVPRSWHGPHVVDYQGHWRFYYRNSAGSHPMDVTELRQSFIFSDSASKSLENFRSDRLAKISSDDILSKKAKIVIHLQPLDSVYPEFAVDFLKGRNDISKLVLINYCADYLQASDVSYLNQFRVKVTFDGLVSLMDRRQDAGYVLLFRNGIVESVDVLLLDAAVDGKRCIDGLIFEMKVCTAVKRYLSVLKALSIESPILLSLSLLGVKGYVMSVTSRSRRFGDSERIEIDRPNLILGSKLIQEIPENVDEGFVRNILRDDFNAIWNATGYDASPSYSDDGSWRQTT